MKRLLIIDGNALVHRAFHALPPLKTKKGELVNAVYGFLSIFIKSIQEFSPDYVCACFDLAAPTFRHQEFKDYKATRPKAPDGLYEQIPKIKEILNKFEVPIYEKKGFEADDVIATISKHPRVEEIESIILSGDLDTLQLVDANTKVFTSRKGIKDTILYDEEAVKERYGLSPVQIPDLKGLTGDTSDNIPGVKGIGPKTASELLQRFGSLEGIYEALEGENVKDQHQRFHDERVTSGVSGKLTPRVLEILLENKEQALFSKMLALVKQDVDIGFEIEKCAWKGFDKPQIIQALRDFEFDTLINRLPIKKAQQDSLF